MNKQSKAEQYLRQIQAIASKEQKQAKIGQIIKELIQSEIIDDWKLLDQVITQATAMQERQSAISRSNNFIAEAVQSSIKAVKTFPMFMFVYWMCCKKRIVGVYIFWRQIYVNICHINQLIQSFNLCVKTSNQQPSSVLMMQQTLLMVANVFPNFLLNQRISLVESEVDAVLFWLSEMVTEDKAQFLYACNLVKLVKQARNINLKDYEQKEHLLLKKIMNLIGQNGGKGGNLYLFFDQFTIKDKDIEYFCHINQGFIEDLDENYICNVFTGLTANGINKEVLALISKISHIMAANEEYYILRVIYQLYLLPVLINDFKTCRRHYLDVYQISQLYVFGFLRHCNIGQDGLECVLNHVEEIQNDEIKQKWIGLAFAAAQKSAELQTFLQKQLTKLGLNKLSQGLTIQKVVGQAAVWSVTIRNGRKHKVYPQIDSKLRGITNRLNECYIISVVQGLYMTGQIYPLVSQYAQQLKNAKMELFLELYYLFSELSGRLECKQVSVKFLKAKGPDFFKESNTQEDAQQYLIYLFEAIQNQIRPNPVFLKKFQSIFKLDYHNVIHCNTCGYQVDDHSISYIHTISHRENFQPVQVESLQNYECGKCLSKTDSIITRTLKSKPRIMILHINRFSYRDGKVCKQLASKPIARNIGDYELVGFVCHRGRDMERGHYIYYAKVQKLRWALMNDKRVTEFNLTSENQEFQRQMKAETTPYILFYRLLAK